jgi:hypothetical protein
MTRKLSSTAFLRTIYCLCVIGWLAVSLPQRSHPSHSQAQAIPIRIPINVHQASLPVTIGVPIGEAAKLLDPAQLGVTNADGNPVPSQMRVLARWGGLVNDANKPIKWLVVDFKPTTTGAHFLTRASRGNQKSIIVSEAPDSLRITHSQLEAVFPKRGEGLIKSFKLGSEEMLKVPVTVESNLPHRAMITHLGSGSGLGPDAIIVTDTSLFKPGDTVRFEHIDTLKWDADVGTSRLVTNTQSLAPNRRYLIDEGTPRQEQVDVNSALPGDLRTSSSLRFPHGPGSTIRDLSVEQEVATIKSIDGQKIQFTSPLKVAHVLGEKVFVPNSDHQTATAVVERATIEESNPMRVVVRQDGTFRTALGKVPPTLAFTLRYYIYADQPFIRVRLRMINNGTYGFGSYRSFQGPYPQHAIMRSLSALFPTVASGSGSVQVLSSAEARAHAARHQSSASISAGSLEIAVPEFAENFPKALRGDNRGIRFDILPEMGSDYVFDGGRAKTTDFYLGQETAAARTLTFSVGATLDPAYVASTGAVRPVFIEKRDWSRAFGKNPQLAEAATRVEKMFAAGYAVEASEEAGAVPAMSMFEYRMRGESGEQFGWRNFGDLAWGDGYANVHYDLPFILLREYLRTGDTRAFQIGSEMARYRADWGHYRADDYIDRERTWNFKGLAFYEKGDHGSFREPVPSHSWIEGMWLYWALTGDEAVRESAVEGSEAFARMNFNYGNALGWNEPRWLGWPTMGLMVAYRYTGELRYLNKARADVNLFLQTEEKFGNKGYYLHRAPDVIQGVQTWAWGYSLLGVIEYWRDTRDQRAGAFIVRVADWLISKGSNNPPLLPGRMLSDRTYLPSGVSYFWYPEKAAEDRSVALAGLCLPVLTTAARITNRPDIWARANEVFRDYAFYRDLPEGKGIPPSSRAVINFRSLLFPGSVTKVYGQMGLTVSDYLPELVASGTIPLDYQADRPEAKSPIASAPSVTKTPTPAPVNVQPAPQAISTSNLTNIATRRPAMASSVKAWPDVIGAATAANDGQRVYLGRTSAWHSASNSGQLEWWQVDLGKSYPINFIEIIFREDHDQPATRRNFEVRGSNDLHFRTSTLLGSQGESVIPFKQSFQVKVKTAESYRYIRVQKTKVDPDAYGDSFFNLVEVLVFTSPATSNSRP